MSEPAEYAIPVQAIAQALHADFESKWGPGSGNMSAHRAVAELAVTALADAELVVVPVALLRDAISALKDLGACQDADCPELPCLLLPSLRAAVGDDRD